MVTRSQTDRPVGRADRRALLIDTASVLFKERPYDEVTTTEIARNAGVAYGLIAHHFTNKRGLYLATISAVAESILEVNRIPPIGDTPASQIREAITRHIRFIEDNAEGFVSLMRGGSGSDPQVRALIDDMRREGASRLLRAFGVTEPVPPVLRTAMRGWLGYLGESILDHLDHLDHHELATDDLVDLAVAVLVASLRAARSIDSGIALDSALIDELEG